MIYYVETNLIACFVGIILLIQARKSSSRNETSSMIMGGLLRLLVLLSLSDILAYLFRGKSYAAVQIFNILYFLVIAIGSYAWFLYVCIKMEYTRNLKKLILLTGSPIFLLCISFFLNPLTGFFFTVDENIIYHRGTGVVLTWIIEWAYMLIALGLNIRAVLIEKRSYRKSEYQGCLIFIIPVAAATICQMIFYGTTTTQIGFMFGMLIVYINTQQFQIQRDDLTGLNNKNAFLHYRDTLFFHTGSLKLTLFMIDGDNFKAINDQYGHMKGDQALRDISNVLIQSVSAPSLNHVILYRYGGDEFVIIGTNMSKTDIQLLKDTIQKQLQRMNEENTSRGEKYTLALSIGHASKACSDAASFDELLKEADQAMYQIKQERKAGNL